MTSNTGNVSDLFDDGKPRYVMIAVTPDMARRWLALNTNNRPAAERKIDRYADDMIHGRWTASNDAICFAPDGRLLNGQHRLHAVVKADCTVMMLVGRNIPPEAMQNMDTGKARTASDALGIGGHGNSARLAATAKFLILVEEDRLSVDTARQEVSHAEIINFVESYPLVAASVDRTQKASRSIDSTPASISSTWYLIAKVDGFQAADDFVSSLASHIGLTEGDPILALASRFRTIRNQRTRMGNKFHVDLMIRAYNARKSGRKIKHLPTQSGKGFVLTAVA